jgi:hypothetical protein
MTHRRGNRHSGKGAAGTSAPGAGQVISQIVHGGMNRLREQAKSQAAHLGEFARERGEALLRDQKDRFAEEIATVSRAVRGAADDLHDGSGSAGAIGEYMDSAADGIARVARLIERTELAEVSRDLKRFARRHPAAVLCSMFVIGLTAGRVVRVGINESS